MWRKRIGVVLVVLGLVLVAGSFVWRSVAVPKLVKYPTDLDETPKYAGTVSIFLDPKTNTPLSTPVVAPLAVSRHIKADGAQSDSDSVLVTETIDLAAEGQFSGTIDAVYVMDRRKAVNLTDPRTWAFTPDNVVDRGGAYRLQFPFDLPFAPVKIYKNEIAGTYMATPVSTGKVEGLDVITFAAEKAPVPVSPAYLTQLDKLTPLPRELTLDQLKPILLANGVDVDKLLPALLPKLSPEDTQALVALAGAPIKLAYLFGFQGTSSVEKTTGSIVDVKDVETLYVTPDASALPPLIAVLGKYPDVPEAVTALDNLQKLAANPVKVFTNDFSQTPESIADIADDVRDAADQKKLAESTLPTGLLVGGIVLVLVGIVLYGFGRRSTKPAAPPAS
jgi:hypothetical protein